MNYETAQNNCKGKFGLFTSNLIEPTGLDNNTCWKSDNKDFKANSVCQAGKY